MKSVYVVKNQTETETELFYFICSLDDITKVKIGGNINTGKPLTLEGWVSNDIKNNFSGITTISSKSFSNATAIKEVFFNKNLKNIKKEAFKDCDGLEIFCCGEETNEETSQIKGVKIYNLGDEKFTIESLAFSKCKNLHTVILPDCKELVIEKDAFAGCSSLRTLVYLMDEIDFTGNPFEDCPETLTFVGKKGSALEKFARENGYGYIDV